MYSKFNKGKSVVAERFIRTLKNNIFKHVTVISKNVYVDVLNDIVNKYNNTVHKAVKIKPTEVTGDYYAKQNEESNKKNPKFKVGDHVRISKYKDILAKGYTPNWTKEDFIVKKFKNAVSWTYVISDIDNEEILGSFYEKELQKTDQKNT